MRTSDCAHGHPRGRARGRVSVRIASFTLFALAAAMLSSCSYRYQEPREPASMIELRSAQLSRQTHEFTCGAAALATVLTRLGTPTTEFDILSTLMTDSLSYRVTASGETELLPLSAAVLSKRAKESGFKAVTVKIPGDTEALSALEKLSPAICRIKLYEDFLHFVVVEGYEENWILISDPAYGRVRIPISQFGKVWKDGDGAMLAVSSRPFLAWKDDAGRIFLKRDPAEIIAKPDAISPAELYNDAARSLPLTNRFQR